MVTEQLVARGVSAPRVLDAMRQVPRHLFVPAEYADDAYADEPLPIGHGQTISQPYIVALMTELAHIEPSARVLEIGTGSGYQAAVLAEMGAVVYSLEVIPALVDRASMVLAQLDYHQVDVRNSDGWFGVPDQAPFDAILVTAAPPQIPPLLLQQLAPGARMVVPVGDLDQSLRVIQRSQSTTTPSFEERVVLPVRFVPMTGQAQRGPSQ